jgi:AcrR family transcriptional regulator
MNMIHKESRLSPRTRRRAAKERRILEAAMDIIAEEGLHACSVHRVADAVDYTPGALYRYFSSKDALLSALVVRVLDTLEGEIRTAQKTSLKGNGLTNVVKAFEVYRRFSVEKPNRFGLLSLMMAQPGTVFSEESETLPAINGMLKTLAPLAEALDECVAQGFLKKGDNNRRAWVLFSGLQGVLQLQKQSRHVPDLLDIHALSEELLRTILSGWGARNVEIESALSVLD